MKIKAMYLCITLFLSFSSVAHEQEKHSAQAPSFQSSCEALLMMDHADRDMSDSVTQAMLEKCQSAPKKDKEQELDEHQRDNPDVQHH